MLKIILGVSVLANVGLLAYLHFFLNWGGSFENMSDSQKQVKCVSYMREKMQKKKSQFSRKPVRHRRRPSRPVEGFENAPQKVVQVPRKELDEHLKNLPRILRDAKVVPYVAPGSGGNISGFKVVSVKQGSVYDRLQIKRGDVVKGLNGKAMDSPQKAMEMYQSIKKGAPIQLQILRDGEPKVLKYQIEKPQ